jgi:hypothetical protein
MNAIYTELQWLTRPALDFSVKLRAVGKSDGPLGCAFSQGFSAVGEKELA